MTHTRLPLVLACPQTNGKPCKQVPLLCPKTQNENQRHPIQRFNLRPPNSHLGISQPRPTTSPPRPATLPPRPATPPPHPAATPPPQHATPRPRLAPPRRHRAQRRRLALPRRRPASPSLPNDCIDIFIYVGLSHNICVSFSSAAECVDRVCRNHPFSTPPLRGPGHVFGCTYYYLSNIAFSFY